MCNYLTSNEFLNDAYYKTLANCANVSGSALTSYIDSLLVNAKAMIDNYLGRDLCEQTYEEELSIHEDSHIAFASYLPIVAVSGLTYDYIGQYDIGYNSSNYSASSGVVTNYKVNNKTGEIKLKFGQRFYSDNDYTLTYVAGYASGAVPEDIKTATKILVAHISQQIDTGQIAVAEGGTLERVKVENDVTAGYGVGKVNKNVIVTNMNDLNNIPVTVFQLLNRYRYS